MQDQYQYRRNNINPNSFRPGGMDEDQYCMLLHLSTLAGYIIPLAGFVVPIIMWTSYKDQSPHIDKHGKMVTNFLISAFIYYAIGIVLSVLCIGFVILIALAVVGIIFSILGAIKASQGDLYEYRLTIKFIE